MPQPELWVVDDDASVRFVLATALRDAGHQVREFVDGATAWSALQEAASPPALLFTDVRMPGDDGLKLLERIKSLHPELPVVVMSAHTDVSSTAGAFRGGAYEFLSKPFDLDDAVGLAARVLDTRTVDAETKDESGQASEALLLIGVTPAV
ncbi:MAG: response regulator, partial [Proteobacteria bacterium]|nr:response regulator [Pseudomonadota bacterium]